MQAAMLFARPVGRRLLTRSTQALPFHAPYGKAALLQASFSNIYNHHHQQHVLNLSHRTTLALGQQVRSFRIGGVKKKKDDNVEDDSVVSPPSTQEDDQQHRLSGRTTAFLSKLGMVGTGLIFLGGKTKYVLVMLKLTKMSSVLSLFASTAAYGFVYGPAFGVGVVSMLLVHESGHAAMMLRLGIPITPMLFVPFMGAVVGMQEHPRSAYEHALVALAGPVVGSAFALTVAAAGIVSDSQFLMAVGDFGLWINLFNLLPIGNLDGGIVAGSLSRWLLVAGLGAGGALLYTGTIVNPLFYLIMFAAGYTTFGRFFNVLPRAGFYEIPRSKKIVIGTSYLALIAALLAAMSWNNRYRKSPAQLRKEKAMKEQGQEHAEPTLGDRIVGWSEEFQDPEYVKDGKQQQDQSLQENDPFFQKTQWK